MAGTRRWFRRTGCAVALACAFVATAVAGTAPYAMSLWTKPKPISVVQFGDGDGRVLSLDAFRGKIVLLNVWATWCLPCRKEMPTLDRLQRELGGAGFQVVPLSIDRIGVEAVRRFYAEIGITNLGLYVDSLAGATRALDVSGLPTTLLIDRSGQELGRLVGPAEWDDPEMIALIKRVIGSNE